MARGLPPLPRSACDGDALAGASNAKIMGKATHANFATTKKYLDLAGAVFHAEAEAQERRLLGPSTKLSTRLAEPQPTSEHAAPYNQAETAAADAL